MDDARRGWRARDQGNAQSDRGTAALAADHSHGFTSLTLNNDGHIQRYDSRSAEKETKNLADQHPDVCEQLRQQPADKRARLKGGR